VCRCVCGDCALRMCMNVSLYSGRWTEQQDRALRDAVAKFHGKNWKMIAREAFGSAKVGSVQCSG
jgi:hypothetical protein